VWHKQHSLPWLVAALSKISVEDKIARELLNATEGVPVDSPAYATVVYYRVRLLTGGREDDKARALLQRFLTSPPSHLSGSSRNLFLAQRMRLATSLRDFLVHAPRPMVDVDYQDGFFGICQAKSCDDLFYGSPAKDKTELRFDMDAASVINLRLPLELMAHAATGAELPEPLRGETAIAAWTRAVMLDRHDIALKLVPEIESAYPKLKENMDSYVGAKPEDKKYAALFVILHFPGMRPYVNLGTPRQAELEKIDSYRDNWWCADLGAKAVTNFEKAEVREIDNPDKPGLPKDAPPYPSFVSAEQARAAQREWQKLARSNSGDIFLTQQTLKWAEDRPQDSRLPEALHLAVRSTRYGCGQAGVSGLSKKAFQLLHKRFPDSKWTKQTRYWF
jgi:hypothetical protein